MAHETRSNGGHQSSAEIERELDRTRARLDEHARALQDRLSPGQLLDQGLERLRGSGSGEFFSNLGRGVRDNPLPVVITGLGIAWLAAASTREHDEDELDDQGGDFGDTVRAAGESVRSRYSSAKESARGAARRARGGLRSAREGIESGRERLGRGGEQLRDGFDRALEEQPMMLGLLGAALGAAIGFGLPASRREDRWMGEASDELKTRAARKGREEVEDVREKAEAAMGGPEPQHEHEQQHEQHGLGGTRPDRTGGAGAAPQPSPGTRTKL